MTMVMALVIYGDGGDDDDDDDGMMAMWSTNKSTGK